MTLRKILLIACIFINWQLAGQDMPVIVISATGGDVMYQSDQGKSIKLIPGATVKKSGKLTIKEGSNILLYHEGQFTNIRQPKTVALTDAFNAENELALNFDTEFGKYVEQAVWNSMNSGWKVKHAAKLGDAWGAEKTGSNGGWGAEKTGSNGGWGAEKTGSNGGWGAEKTGSNGGWGAEKTGSNGGWGAEKDPSKGGWGAEKTGSNGGWGAEKTGSVGGWSAESMKAQPACPGGKYTSGINRLEWSKIKGNKDYTFYIFDDNGKQIYQQAINQHFIEINTGLLPLQTNKDYFWLSATNEASPIRTLPVKFNVIDKAEFESINQEGMNSGIYNLTNDVTKDLMRAVLYDNRGLKLEAFRVYRELIKKDPKNSLVKMLYARFCTRLGETQEAKSILAK